MKNGTNPRLNQRGIILLEGLIAILIFSVGILGLVGLQAMSINNSNAAKYRSEAVYFANQIIAQMWADNKVTMKTDYDSPTGAKYVAWRDQINAAGGLPGAAANLPTIAVDNATRRVTVIVQWRAPRDPNVHNHTAIAQIVDN